MTVPNAALRWRPDITEVAEDVDLEAYSQPSGEDGSESSDPSAADTRDVLWVLTEDKLRVRPISVEPGMSDGFHTEVRGDRIEEGLIVVIGRKQDQEEGLNNLLVPQQARGRD